MTNQTAEALPAANTERDQLLQLRRAHEMVAQQWDGCEWKDGGVVDVGASLRHDVAMQLRSLGAETPQVDIADVVLYAAVAEAVKQGLLPAMAHGENEYLKNYDRIKAVLAAAKIIEGNQAEAWQYRTSPDEKWCDCSEANFRKYQALQYETRALAVI